MRWITTWIACCMVVCALSVHAQEWERLNVSSSLNLRPYDIAVSDSKWVIGGIGGVYGSSDRGDTWLQLDSTNVRSVLFLNNSVGWIAGEHDAILRTDDGGQSWQEQHLDMRTQYLRAISFINPEQGIAVGEHNDVHGNSIYWTDDGGLTWNVAPNPVRFYNPDILGLYYSPGGIAWAVGGYYADSKPLFFRSANNGQSWDTVEINTTGWLTCVHFWSETEGVTAGRSGMIFRTMDGGQTWSGITTTNTNTIRDFAALGDSMLFAAAHEGYVGVSRDRGLTWDFRNLGYNDRLDGVAITPQNEVVVTGARPDGMRSVLAVSSDSGLTWTTKMIDGVFRSHAIAASSEGSIVVTSFSGGFMHSANSGQSWDFHGTPLDFDFSGAKFFDSRHGLVVGGQGIILNTWDGGEHWGRLSTEFSYGLTGVEMLSLNKWIIVSQDGVVLLTEDGGSNWEVTHENPSQHFRDVHFGSQSFGWVVGDSGAVLRTLDGGESWDSLNFAYRMNYNGVHCFANGDAVLVGDDNLTISAEINGQVWEPTFLPQNVELNSVRFGDDSTGWVAGRNGALYYTMDRGQSWTHIPNIFDDFEDIAVEDSTIYLLNDRGEILQGTFDFISPVEQEPVLPQSYSLSAYPNPFNSTATLQFTLPREARTEIVLYDVLGRVAMQLADNIYTAGSHNLQINAEGLASGVYFAELRTPEFSSTQKLLLLR